MAYLDSSNVSDLVADIKALTDAAYSPISMIGASEATSTATSPHVSGTYFIYDNTFYVATANIAVGDTITPSTNCTATSITAVLSALHNLSTLEYVVVT